MKEEYRDIAGYEGLYQVSNYGNIKRLGNNKTKKEKILKQKIDGGYLRVGLSKNNKQKYYLVHRLVAQAFIPNPDGKEQVNHINGIKSDNNVSNLEWVTCSENMIHAFRTGLHSIDSFQLECAREHSNKTKSKQVICITTGIFYESVREAERQTGVASSSISNCCRGKIKYAGKLNGKKLIWEYIKE